MANAIGKTLQTSTTSSRRTTWCQGDLGILIGSTAYDVAFYVTVENVVRIEVAANRLSRVRNHAIREAVLTFVRSAFSDWQVSTCSVHGPDRDFIETGLDLV